MMPQLRTPVSVLAIASSVLCAQAQNAGPSQSPPVAGGGIAIPKYDVISVKPNKGVDQRIMFLLVEDGFEANNIPVHLLITNCFGVTDDEVIGEPNWAKEDRFDIEAKVAGPDVAELSKLTIAQKGPMLEQILTERFQFAAHQETRELPVYILTVAKGGPKLAETKVDPDHLIPANSPGRFITAPGEITAQGASIAAFASFIARPAGRKVIDKTGLTGHYDFTFDRTPPNPNSTTGSLPIPGDSGVSLSTALEDELGLKLESSEGPVDVIVIDHIERPSAN